MTAPTRGGVGERSTSEDDAASIASPAQRPVLSRVLRYARLGYDVLPLKRDSKEPDTRNGLKDATRDAEQIKRWYRALPERNWGILAPHDVLVLDFDEMKSLHDVLAAYPVLTDAPWHRTPRGAHLFTRVPAGWTTTAKAKPLPDVDMDVRGLGKAYVVAPPSTVGGRLYRAKRCLVSPPHLPLAPSDLLTRLAPTPRPPTSSVPRQLPEFKTAAERSRYLREAVERERVAVAHAPSGKRNDTLLLAATNLGELIGPDQLAEAEVRTALLLAAEQCGLSSDEAERTITNGFEYGAKHPRQPRRRSAAWRATVVQLSTVEPEPVSFLWDPYLPLGKLALLEGDPGLGKTWLALDIAARITRGEPLPGEDIEREPRQPRNVLYLSAEDDPGDTLRPRLEAAGADLDLVFIITGKHTTDENGDRIQGSVTIDDPVIRGAVELYRPALVVVDPLQAYLGAGVDMHRANETRPVLTTLSDLAAEFKFAVLLVRHLRKSNADRAIHRGMGSIDFSAAARSVLLVDKHPHDDRRRVVAHVKSSLAEAGPSQMFELRNGVLRWLGKTDITAEQLNAARPEQGNKERSAVEEAVDWLRDQLSNGPVAVKTLEANAKDAGVASWSTIKQYAKPALEIRSIRSSDGNSGAGSWMWCLPVEIDYSGFYEAEE